MRAYLLHGAFGRSLGWDGKGPNRPMISHLVLYIPFHYEGTLALAYEANDRHTRGIFYDPHPNQSSNTQCIVDVDSAAHNTPELS